MTQALVATAPSQGLADARLVLTELVTNAVKHGKPDARNELEVGWSLFEGTLCVCVCDAGTSSAFAPREVAPDAEGGRGLLIVDALVDSWTLELGEGSTRVVANIACCA
jgi:serine/threonine-protein kinase RsbW